MYAFIRKKHTIKYSTFLHFFHQNLFIFFFWSRDSQVNFSIYFKSILAPMCFHPTPICKQANKNIDAHVFILVCSGALLVWPSLLRSTDARQVNEVVYRAETLLSTNTGALTSNMQYHII